jgi:hypothetical protein
MATGLHTKERVRARTGGEGHVRPDLERRLALFVLGLTLTILAFLAYGGRNDMAEFRRNATPIHIFHHDYSQSGNL